MALQRETALLCYVPSITNKQKSVIALQKQGLKFDDFSLYRYKENVLETVSRDLAKMPPTCKDTVFFCTTCDPCATLKHAETTIEAIRLIMARSRLQVRVLSKSVFIKDIASALIDYKERIVYSLSTGTSLDEISKAIEEHASPVRLRVETLHWLQNNNFRTYGMICPVIPSEISRVKQLLDQVRPEICEYVWVEAVNVRGKSLFNTFTKLNEAGPHQHAAELQRVMGEKNNWRDYSKNLFVEFQSEMKNRGLLEKLRFLQYVTKTDVEFFHNQPGAICL